MGYLVALGLFVLALALALLLAGLLSMGDTSDTPAPPDPPRDDTRNGHHPP